MPTTQSEPRDLLYLRHSTDKQTNARQMSTLSELLAAGAPRFEDPATSSRVPALERKGFGQLLQAAAVGDTIRVADAARLFRSVRDVLDIREVLGRRGLHLRIATGAWSGFDLAANDPQSKLFITMLGGVLEFQRDMISENTKEGVSAARERGKTLGRPAVLNHAQREAIVTAFREGTAVKALAREHAVSPRTVRNVLDDFGARAGALPKALTETLERDLAVRLPGLLAAHLDAPGAVADTDAARAWAEAETVHAGRGKSVVVTAPLGVHRALLGALGVLGAANAEGVTAAERKAYRTYAARIEQAQGAVPPRSAAARVPEVELEETAGPGGVWPGQLAVPVAGAANVGQEQPVA